MPWQEIRVEEQRILMIQDRQEGMSISEFSEIYSISLKTVYKWLERRPRVPVQRPPYIAADAAVLLSRCLVTFRRGKTES